MDSFLVVHMTPPCQTFPASDSVSTVSFLVVYVILSFLLSTSGKSFIGGIFDIFTRD